MDSFLTLRLLDCGNSYMRSFTLILLLRMYLLSFGRIEEFSIFHVCVGLFYNRMLTITKVMFNTQIPVGSLSSTYHVNQLDVIQ